MRALLLLLPLVLLPPGLCAQAKDQAQAYCETLIRARLASLGAAVFEEVAQQDTQDGSLVYRGQLQPLKQQAPMAFLCQLEPRVQGWSLKRLELYQLVEQP
ncbi:hypothetical protein [Gallaecimonas sp. GXIMD4217]|uniref:hypothetical protein n=1 Tax=Gallaecimonas sp. GXIMD4217 TaxID=3131927 RepID=UPI00311B2951